MPFVFFNLFSFFSSQQQTTYNYTQVGLNRLQHQHTLSTRRVSKEENQKYPSHHTTTNHEPRWPI
jgi:hypothetical protein